MGVSWPIRDSHVIRGVNCGRDTDRVITRELPSWTVRKIGYITKALDRAGPCARAVGRGWAADGPRVGRG